MLSKFFSWALKVYVKQTDSSLRNNYTSWSGIINHLSKIIFTTCVANCKYLDSISWCYVVVVVKTFNLCPVSVLCWNDCRRLCRTGVLTFPILLSLETKVCVHEKKVGLTCIEFRDQEWSIRAFWGVSCQLLKRTFQILVCFEITQVVWCFCCFFIWFAFLYPWFDCTKGNCTIGIDVYAVNRIEHLLSLFVFCTWPFTLLVLCAL